jgi:hypothetical protein
MAASRDPDSRAPDREPGPGQPPFPIDVEEIAGRRGQTVIDAQDQRLGKLEEIYLDPDTGHPAFACVKVGLLGRRQSFVSLTGAAMEDGYVRVAYLRAQVKNAPRLPPEPQLTRAAARQLSEHYALQQPPVHAPDLPAGDLSATDYAAGDRELMARLDALERRVRALQETLG